MEIRDYFKPVDTMTTEQVQEFLNRHDPAHYNLVDVRQPGEYQQQHLPGARLIPLAELPEVLPVGAKDVDAVEVGDRDGVAPVDHVEEDAAGAPAPPGRWSWPPNRFRSVPSSPTIP